MYKIWLCKQGSNYTYSKTYLVRLKLLANCFASVCRLLPNTLSAHVFKVAKYSFDGDLGIDYADVAPWRSYNLWACGDSLDELLDDAAISEIDQDGGELRCYAFSEASNDVQDAVLKTLYKLTFGKE